MKLKYYSDSGHGWIACKIALLDRLGIDWKISCYSYMRGKTAYLEEDQDAGFLLEALKSKGIEYTITFCYCNRSPIRSYESYDYSKIPAKVPQFFWANS